MISISLFLINLIISMQSLKFYVLQRLNLVLFYETYQIINKIVNAVKSLLKTKISILVSISTF